MRIIRSMVAAIGVLATALAFAASQPAAAGPACAKLGSSSPCIRGNDLKARLDLDEDGKDARLRLRNEDGESGMGLDAESFNVTNFFSNEEDRSNGLVKAWARIDQTGIILACWRCNTDPAETRKLGTGVYKVDFTPLATDITGRPMSGVVVLGHGMLDLNNDLSDRSSVFVNTADRDGLITDRSFILIIF
jgi:hypothetical protein